MKKMNKKGFTLIEMLVVIAIIAVLVSIVIPVVGNSTEKAKEAADAANIRSAIAKVTTKALSDGEASEEEVTMTQGEADFVSSDLTAIGGLSDDQFEAVAAATKDTVVVISADANGAITVTVGDGDAIAPETEPTT